MNTKSEFSMSLGEISLIAGTRVMMGAGLAMLLGDRLSADQRKATGWTLFVIGTLVSFPLAFQVFSERRLLRSEVGEEKGHLKEVA